MPPRKTLWEEGRHPGRLIRTVSVAACLLVAVLEATLADDLGLAYDVVFVVACIGAALAVRPRDFFMVGVLPPLLMLSIMALFAIVARAAVADPGDGVVQATVSGLAHHAGALVLGYGFALAVLALRQVALRNSGSIRAHARPAGARGRAHVPAQREPMPTPVRR